MNRIYRINPVRIGGRSWLPPWLGALFAGGCWAARVSQILESRKEIVRAVVAPPPVLVQAPQTNGVKLQRHLGIEARRRDRFLRTDLLSNIALALSGEGRLAGQQFVKDQAQAVNVCVG